jgi:hypothetical protein
MILTKADVYERTIFAERPICPHCGQEMKIWECIETGFSCGSGWGTPYLFACFNDECPPFQNGWESMKKNYGKKCSYRCICFPDSRVMEMMLVYSLFDGKTSIVDEDVIAADKKRGTDQDPAIKELLKRFGAKDVRGLLSDLLNEKAYYKVRQKAADLIGELGRLEVIEQLRNYHFKDQRILASVRNAIDNIHQANDTRECPYCCEIVSASAGTCAECGKTFDAE